MTNVKGLVVGVLVVGLLVMAAVPASAQSGDPLRLASSGVLLPFFSDGAAGFVSILEIASPVVPTVSGTTFPFDFTNPLHAIFFTETCVRNKSISDEETAKQAKAFITSAAPLTLNFNGLAAIATSINGNDLVPLNFPIHSRTHWIDVKTGRLRVLEPITLDTFLSLDAAFLPLVVNFGAGASIGRCNFLTDALGNPPFTNGFCWNPLSSAVTFVTPQETASIAASIIMICPTSDIQSTTGGGVFPIANGFPRMVNRDGSFGFSGRNVITGNNVTTLRGRIYNDDESGPKDILVPCTCLSTTAVAAIDSIYSTPPVNLGAHTVPVWYTELESQAVTSNSVTGVPVPQHFSFTGYWNLQVAGSVGTLFHRMSSASLDNLTNGFNNAFGNR